MKLIKKRKRTGRVAVLLLLLFAFAHAVHAAPNAECDAGRHQYEEIRRVAATATEDGLVTYLCVVCGQQYTQNFYATNHLWGEWVTDKPPTCIQPGEKHRTCTRALRHDEYAEIPALGHNYVASVTTEPGCEAEGVKTFACARCGGKYTQPIPPVGHDYEESIAREPSCLEPGLKVFVCVHDPAHTYEEDIPAIGGHSFSEWCVETPAGEGTEGLEARVCTHDGFKETRKLEALPVPSGLPVIDIILVSANVGFAGFFLLLSVPYILFLKFIKKQRSAVERRDALRKKVEVHYGFK